MALVRSKHIELKAGISLRRVLRRIKKNVGGEILNEMTRKIVRVKASPTTKMKEIRQKLLPPH